MFSLSECTDNRPIVLNLRLHVATPSNHLCPTFFLWVSPQFVNQAPPGAQQLLLPDFVNVPHLGQVIVNALGVLAISSLSGDGGGDGWSSGPFVVSGVDAAVHTASDIDPDEPSNMRSCVAFELIQASPQSVCLKDSAWSNI